jgi:hypothetical protein
MKLIGGALMPSGLELTTLRGFGIECYELAFASANTDRRRWTSGRELRALGGVLCDFAGSD